LISSFSVAADELVLVGTLETLVYCGVTSDTCFFYIFNNLGAPKNMPIIVGARYIIISNDIAAPVYF